MKVFVAGGTGVIGRHLVPLLTEKGCDVVALARTPDKVKAVEALGAKAIIADALDEKALSEAVIKVEPEVIVHQLTSHGGLANFKKMDDDFRVTNRLRIETTSTLLKAASVVGTRRLVVQSFCGLAFAREGGWVKREDAPLDSKPPAGFRKTVEAIRYLEDSLLKTKKIEGIALRYGFLYGPGTSISADGELVAMVRRRQFPIVGNGAGVWSFTHAEDAARAAAAAIFQGRPGVYNVVDDEPAPVADWLPALAQCVGAKKPRRIPTWLARPVLGEGGIAMMTQARGGANAKAKKELDWQLAFPSWRKGFVHGL